MSILSNVIKVVGSIAENLEDIEAMKTFRMSNDNAARSESRTTVVTPMTCPKCGSQLEVKVEGMSVHVAVRKMKEPRVTATAR